MLNISTLHSVKEEDREEVIQDVFNKLLSEKVLQNLRNLPYINIDNKAFKDLATQELLREHLSELSDSELLAMWHE